MKFAIAVHGGAGSPEEWKDGCIKACERGFLILKEGGTSLSAVIEAVRILEDDGRFNAGKGASLRIDGKTIEMDASIMTSTGAVAVVMAVRDVKNPVLLASALLGSPHVAIAGRGATELARRLGLERHPGPSERAKESYRRFKRVLNEGRIHELNPLWKNIPPGFLVDTVTSPLSTVGAVAVDINGNFAVASSTGGASPMLPGRVGDTPFIGCGFYAGPLGAIAVTGIGEEIIKRMVAFNLYRMLEAGRVLKESAEALIKSFPQEIPVGIIAVSKEEIAGISNREMAWASMMDIGY